MSDLRTLRLADLPRSRGSAAALRPVTPADRDALARAYLDGYPPEVGASDPADAAAEIDATFAGDYGRLRTDASLVAEVGGRLVGAALTVERSIWDPDLDGPFLIDLFVVPSSRRRGVGESLLRAAAAACRAAGDTSLSLRVGDGTSPAAHQLYARLGFREPA